MNTYTTINRLKDFRIELHKNLFDPTNTQFSEVNISSLIDSIKSIIETNHKEITINNINSNYFDSRVDIMFTHHKINIDQLRNDISVGYLAFLMKKRDLIYSLFSDDSKQIYEELIESPTFIQLLFSYTVVAVEPNQCTCVLFI